MSTVLTQAVARLLAAPIAIVALAFLAKGFAGVGDGFAAGALAALGVILQLLAFGHEHAERSVAVRLAPVATTVGLLLVLAVAIQSVLRGKELLAHAPEHAPHIGTIELSTAFGFDAGIFLLVFGAVLIAVDAVARVPRGRP